MEKQSIRENRFDIDIGYITKSPCRECPIKSSLPECSSCCERLTQLQELLAGSISCSKNFSECEEYSI
ncbi:MAG: hypothetical protein JRE28_09085 [Deltaproteobacteria bacterium]|nr:hypothetical protein [Deltaproteobacteria bacterium]